MPTARHIWEAVQTTKPKVLESLGQDESFAAYERLLDIAEQAGKEVFDSLQQEHRSSIAREEDRGQIAFESRRKIIERVGLPEVRQFRMARLENEEAEWRKELETAKQIVPEIRPLLLMRIVEGGDYE
jgi:CO dehydrogenase/acetyl-CoA synthase beta subunit